MDSIIPQNTKVWGFLIENKCAVPKRTYPIVPAETVVDRSKAFPCISASVGSSHQIFNNQSHINQVDFIPWREISLEIQKVFLLFQGIILNLLRVFLHVLSQV